MSFFKDFKGDLSQSINEMMKEKKHGDNTQEESLGSDVVVDMEKGDVSLDETSEEELYQTIMEAAEDLLNSETDEETEEQQELEELEELQALEELQELKELQELQELIVEKDAVVKEEDTKESPSRGNRTNEESSAVEMKQLDDTRNGENTMVDFEESVVDEELLDTLLQEEEKNGNKTEEQRYNSNLKDEDRDAVTVITKGTTINGSIISDCSLDVMGTINGDIECLGKLSISGHVTGNSMAAEVYVNTERLEGSINSEGSVKIGLGTVIIGDITASSGVIAGAVKGEIDINGPVVIDSTAIIKGNIKAKSVQMNNGAVLEGFCSLSYASVDINNVFE